MINRMWFRHDEVDTVSAHNKETERWSYFQFSWTKDELKKAVEVLDETQDETRDETSSFSLFLCIIFQAHLCNAKPHLQFSFSLSHSQFFQNFLLFICLSDWSAFTISLRSSFIYLVYNLWTETQIHLFQVFSFQSINFVHCLRSALNLSVHSKSLRLQRLWISYKMLEDFKNIDSILFNTDSSSIKFSKFALKHFIAACSNTQVV